MPSPPGPRCRLPLALPMSEARHVASGPIHRRRPHQPSGAGPGQRPAPAGPGKPASRKPRKGRRVTPSRGAWRQCTWAKASASSRWHRDHDHDSAALSRWRLVPYSPIQRSQQSEGPLFLPRPGASSAIEFVAARIYACANRNPRPLPGFCLCRTASASGLGAPNFFWFVCL
jgi:hypothetical protein